MRKKKITKLIPLIALLGALAFAISAQAQSGPGQDVPRPDGPTATALDAPVFSSTTPTGAITLDSAVAAAEGRMSVSIRLSEPVSGVNPSAALVAEQEAAISQIMALDPTARVYGQAQILINALFVEMDAAAAAQMMGMAGVTSVKEVGTYELDLSETVPYIGASVVQDLGYDGSGVLVAVLDSGIDYTHANLGGGGTLADYAAAYGAGPGDPLQTTRDGLFPTAKVVEGYDFVGEAWPFGPVAMDDDPIDFEGHGTHVADIIAGAGGVAPGADLLGYKVCSAVAPNCEGAALILAMEASTLAGADIIHMSLGSNYGQSFDDDLSFAVEQAAQLGILTVASAGNGGNNQYIVGSPSTAPSALSVAQTSVPSAVLDQMQVEGGDTWVAIAQPWAPTLTSAITAPAVYGDGAGGNLNGCAAFAPGTFSGEIVLVDRGACNFTLKIKNISEAGGGVGIIGLVAAGDPFSGGDGGDRPINIPGFMVSQAAANDFKAAAAAGLSVTFDPAVGLPLIGTMVGSSSRGPSNTGVYTGFFSNRAENNMLKPEIGAPGASISAEAGTGTGETPFGGTSGAAPMVTGSAALLMEAIDWLRPDQYKAILMGTAETEIYTTAPGLNTQLAPISRIGGGEVRVDRALESPIVAYTEEFTGSSVVSVGQVDVHKRTVIYKRIVIDNISGEVVKLDLTPTFRDAAKDNGAVTVKMPKRVTIPPYQNRIVNIRFILNPEFLPEWTMDIGPNGNGAAQLDLMEVDGYITMDIRGDASDDADPAHVGWHVLPRKAGRILVRDTDLSPTKELLGLPAHKTRTVNRGAGDTDVFAYSLLRISDDIPGSVEGAQLPIVDIKEIGYTTFLDPGCSAGWGFDFAISAHDRYAHEFPASFEINIDTDNDGLFDHQVFNFDLGLLLGGTDGRNAVFADNLVTGSRTVFFFTTHPTNYNGYVLTVCGEQLGFSDTSAVGQPMPMFVRAFDNYFSGIYTDIETGMVISPLGERYFTLFDDGVSLSTSTTLGNKENNTTYVVDFGAGSPSSDIGALLMYFDGAPVGMETEVIYPEP
ncbi:MAG: S8 family serine peptidase [Ardenticatenaceae bacterium]|nr:S8 family serine peptidase [Ardenticatenaceae bacterium]